MQKWKRIVIALLALVFLTASAGCAVKQVFPTRDTLRIVTTIFPVYDWVVRILGQRASDAEVTLLLDSRVDLHSYRPTAKDLVKIAECDLFLYVGGESDAWVEDALKGCRNERRVAVNLLEALGDAVREETILEGMEADQDGSGEEIEYDEHIWLSLRNAAALCEGIAWTLGEIDPAHRTIYTGNAEAYVHELNALDGEYRSTVQSGAVRAVLFGDRFPFRYLTEDYGLDAYAAFSGCSAETEASFETVAFLAGKLASLGLPAVLICDGGNEALAQTIIETSGVKDVKILSLDSLQSTTVRDIQNGASYLGAMEDNLSVLAEALGVTEWN